MAIINIASEVAHIKFVRTFDFSVIRPAFDTLWISLDQSSPNTYALDYTFKKIFIELHESVSRVYSYIRKNKDML